MIPWLSKLGRSFRCAFAGLAWLIRSQRNAKIHALATAAVTIAGVRLEISGMEWCMVALACGMVFTAEALNSAIEKLADRITTETDERIRVAKDVAAAAVLIAATTAVIIGLVIFLPRLRGSL